jgi:hypothetical protein
MPDEWHHFWVFRLRGGEDVVRTEFSGVASFVEAGRLGLALQGPKTEGKSMRAVLTEYEMPEYLTCTSVT